MLAFTFLLCLPLGSAAASLSASDPEGVVSHLRLAGIDAELQKDDFGDPKIEVKRGNTRFSIYFYGCKQSSACTSMQFFAGFRTAGEWTIDHANIWNRERRFTRAYVTDEGSARLEMDIMGTEKGIDIALFNEFYVLWARNLGDFESVIGW